MSKKSKHNKLHKLKGPLFVTVALISCYPIWIAQEALAASSDGLQTSSAALRTGNQQQTAGLRSPLGLSLQHQSKTMPSLIQTRFPYVSPQDLIDAQAELAKAESAYNNIKTRLADLLAELNTLNTKVSDAQHAYDIATSNLETASANLEAAKSQKEAATQEALRINAIYENALAAKNSANDELNYQLQIKAAAQQTFDEALAAKQTALATLNSSEASLAAALLTKNEKYAALQQAQSNYDTNLIPDPTWTPPTQQVAHTRQVPHTTTRIDTQTIPNILFNSDFSRGTEGWSGVYPGWQGSSPALVNNQVTFSYQTQTVSQGLYSGPFQNATLTLSADWSNNDLNRGFVDVYSMTVEARDINQNPVGLATYNSTGSHAWENKSVTLQATGPVSYITISFTGIDAGYWYGTYGPSFKNPVLSISHGQEITETTYTTETYYTTEPVLTQGTINVDIREGGQATFNAPAGATFISSNLRYEAIARPECGANISPNVNGLSTVTLRALNSVYGDPCGGWVKHITGTISYLGQPTAPLIKDASLLPAVTSAQEEYDAALAEYNNASASQTSAQTSYEAASVDFQIAEADLLSARSSVTSAESELLTKTTSYEEVAAAKTTTEQELTTATELVATSEEFVSTTQADQTAKAVALETTNKELTSVESSVVETKKEVVVQETKVKTLKEKVAIIEATPEPEPEPEGAKEIPTDLSADNLMEVNLDSVDPTELTEAQAEQLKEAALETFETAEEGSPEYEQALDALYLAAEQDDIVLDPALAAIPGLAAATELVNFLGNAGADMSPKVREESEKVVVTAVVAAGAAIQSAAAAASTASASSSGSAGRRR